MDALRRICRLLMLGHPSHFGDLADRQPVVAGLQSLSGSTWLPKSPNGEGSAALMEEHGNDRSRGRDVIADALNRMNGPALGRSEATKFDFAALAPVNGHTAGGLERSYEKARSRPAPDHRGCQHS